MQCEIRSFIGTRSVQEDCADQCRTDCGLFVTVCDGIGSRSDGGASSRLAVQRFIERFKEHKNVSFEIIDDKQSFAAEADVLISCVTVATELLFPDDSLFKKGVTVVPVHMRGFQNCDLFFDKVYGDDTGQICNFKYYSQFRAYDELHHVLQGKNPGRVNEEERILSYNYGLGLHDVFFASKIYELIGDAPGFDFSRQEQKVWV